MLWTMLLTKTSDGKCEFQGPDITEEINTQSLAPGTEVFSDDCPHYMTEQLGS